MFYSALCCLQFHTSQNSPAKDPLVTWHQGGPGASSINLGLYTEMGYFQVDDTGAYANEYAWNKVANMLYLESPAGSGSGGLGGAGSSECRKGGKTVACEWDDGSQAEAYAHTLAAFHKAFPEYAKHDLYLTGESYFGQYGPNIANFILTTAPFNSTLNLRGIAQGNAVCRQEDDGLNGPVPNPHGGKNDLDMYWGKGLVSNKLYNAAYKACGFPGPGDDAGVQHSKDEASCNSLIEEAFDSVGPHNTYFLYDNCDLSHVEDFLKHAGKSYHWYTEARRVELLTNGASQPLTEAYNAYRAATIPAGRALAEEAAINKTGGFPWSCGGESATRTYLTRPDVKKALHLRDAGKSSFHYRHGGGGYPSFSIWPFLASKLHVLVYSGDSDTCVPYKGSEDWVTELEAEGVLKETEAWRPWFSNTGKGRYAPSGYATMYKPAAAPERSFGFVTIRLAGHMVPTFMPKASLEMISRFLGGKPY